MSFLMSPEELAWAAGFLEGEGFFQLRPKGRKTRIIGANQVNKEPLERLQELFGGKLSYRSKLSNNDGYARRNWWGWQLDDQERVLELTALISPWLTEERRARIPWL